MLELDGSKSVTYNILRPYTCDHTTWLGNVGIVVNTIRAQ